MKSFIVALVAATIIALSAFAATAQASTLSGYVRHCGTGQGVNGVTVYIHNLTTGAWGATYSHSAPYPGWYGFTGLVPGWRYTVSAGNWSVTFTASSSDAFTLCV